MRLRRAPLLTLLLTLGVSAADARVRLGESLPAHPWTAAEREVVVVYSHDCGDLGDLWDAVLASGLPVRAVNAEGIQTPAPAGLRAWDGEAATAFARKLRVGAYPTVLLVQGGRILNAWEGTFTGQLE
ncbi:penicillin-binding protein [Deinococcus sp. HMF7620]|uniref:Penicillin-binding protein n=1 Tax=Deinococcus arboris TaxID=2682977 RepID=A0A7C9LK31_9DEIO|nr:MULTISPECIES: penicillin-binding protein [Deinococcus]MBZ9751656.1 penicillin-binding protein [Deinococcus betulae]MVN85517.1 penicillin-binding protein [Deinococcus arboris]